ncbi:MAG: SMP-30/gluconolactonase/LRE family protein [Spirochaetia bacterium]|nr:SMP-30/gluconolactonase/LRE family protein [Spirochaetia bacterium]
MNRRLKQLAVILLLIEATVFLYLRGPVDAVAYEPPKAPALAGVLTPNDALKQAELIAKGKIVGPEAVEVDAKGWIYFGTPQGKVMRAKPPGELETYADTGGRPFGLHFDRAGNLIVCDAWKGLLSVDKRGHITSLVSEADGIPFGFTDDLDIASDGRIYFTDASSKFHQPDYMYDMYESRPHGRLMRYDPGTKKTETLLRDLYFANGVALSQNEDFVLVNETFRFRITRFWLKGAKAGQHDVFADNLPGYPDNISANRKGTFWLALFTVRNPIGDFIAPHPRIKNFVAKLPRFMWPKPKPYGFVAALNEKGEIVRTLQDPSGEHMKVVTSVIERAGYLYMGSLYNDRIGRLRVPAK